MTQRPARFEAYATDRFIEIVKTWANHSWPITSRDAQLLFEQTGYTEDPDDPEMYFSDYAEGGEADSYFTTRDGNVSTVDINITKYYNPNDRTVDIDTVKSVYKKYCEAVDQEFRNKVSQKRKKPEATEWILNNGVLIWVGNPGRIITLYIESPRLTQLLHEEREMGLTSYDEIVEDD